MRLRHPSSPFPITITTINLPVPTNSLCLLAIGPLHTVSRYLLATTRHYPASVSLSGFLAISLRLRHPTSHLYPNFLSFISIRLRHFYTTSGFSMPTLHLDYPSGFIIPNFHSGLLSTRNPLPGPPCDFSMRLIHAGKTPRPSILHHHPDYQKGLYIPK